MGEKLLVIGSNSLHVFNFIDLVKDHFDQVLLLTDKINSNQNVNAIAIDFSLGWNILFSVKKIRQQIDFFNPSIIHIHQANSYAFLTIMAVQKYNIPIVLTAWGSDILINPKKSIFLKKMLQYVLKNVDAITADSNHVLSSAQKLVQKKLLLHNVNFGIDIRSCKNIQKENIIYSNRLHKNLYNIDKVIISFSKFLKVNPEWKLVIAGSGDQTSRLVNLVEKLAIKNDVSFIGFVDAKENYYNYCKSKVYVSIPESDSISLSLVEALVYGCISFVSNLDANLEIIEDGQNGFVEKNLVDINFGKYSQIKEDVLKKTVDHLKITFSKSYNKKRYLEIYNEVKR